MTTLGIHHLGLGTSKLDLTTEFFTKILGFKVVGAIDTYPAKFVSDGHILLTLWNIDPAKAVPFDRRANIGLHHFALKISSYDKLLELDEIIKKEKELELKLEFSPQPVGAFAPNSYHLMVYEPSGIRIELWADKQ